MDYAVPRADGLPLFRTEISEVPSTTNPLGMRGGSEGGITPGTGGGGERDRRRAGGIRRRAYRAAGDTGAGLARDPQRARRS